MLSISEAALSPFSLRASSSEPTSRRPRHSGFAPLPIAAQLARKAFFKFPSERSESTSAKRLCTGDELLGTKLETPATAGRSLPYRADVEPGYYTKVSVQSLLLSDFVSRSRSQIDGSRFWSMIAMDNCPFVSVRSSQREDALGACNLRVASLSQCRLRQIPMLVALGSFIVDVLFVKCKSKIVDVLFVKCESKKTVHKNVARRAETSDCGDVLQGRFVCYSHSMLAKQMRVLYTSF